MIYDCPILYSDPRQQHTFRESLLGNIHGESTPVLRFPTPAWEFGIAPRISTNCSKGEIIMIDHDYVKEHVGEFPFLDSAMVEAILGVDFKTSCLTHDKVCEIHVPPEVAFAPQPKRQRTCAVHVPVLLHKLHEGLQLYHRITDHEHGYKGKFILNDNNCAICHQDTTWICRQEILPAFDK